MTTEQMNELYELAGRRRKVNGVLDVRGTKPSRMLAVIACISSTAIVWDQSQQ